MRIGVNKRTIQIPANMTSLSPEGRVVLRSEHDKFYEVVAGVAHEYFDPNLGLITFEGRTYVRTDATSFVRDGTDFTVYLPSENKFITRPALASDTDFREYDFAQEGIWKSDHVSPEKLFGKEELIAKSFSVAGDELLTRRNGEVFVRRDGYVEPFFASQFSSEPHFLRIDLEGTRNNTGEVTSLFLEPNTSPAARRWLEHFTKTQAIVRNSGAREASPFIRNYNTVFYFGEEDLSDCIGSLSQTVDLINARYVSDLESSNGGKLWQPTIEDISSALLNQLHFEFENFGERYKRGSPLEQQTIADVYGPFCLLNDQIHATEGALANRHRTIENSWWALHCSFLPDFYSPLKEEMYSEFTLDWEFGTLFMGYHTLGKDILAAFWNNDMGLFERDEIRPQRISSSEIFMFLGPDSRGQMIDMEKWWAQNNIDSYGYKFGDPRNSIGYIPVAKLVRHGCGEVEIKNVLKGCRKILGVCLACV